MKAAGCAVTLPLRQLGCGQPAVAQQLLGHAKAQFIVEYGKALRFGPQAAAQVGG